MGLTKDLSQIEYSTAYIAGLASEAFDPQTTLTTEEFKEDIKEHLEKFYKVRNADGKGNGKQEGRTLRGGGSDQRDPQILP